jgi:tRNA ligase
MNGEKWLLKHLASKNKTAEQLAATLWDKNWTAIAEVCNNYMTPYSPC